MKPWLEISIKECNENLLLLPEDFIRFTPHPYKSLGANYGFRKHPWFLREGVLKKLLEAKSYLKEFTDKFQFKIFDCWRPIEVQRFMFNLTCIHECQKAGYGIVDESNIYDYPDVIEIVKRFWALPSIDLRTPPPHSTGGAIDLTLADFNGIPIDMGGEIDEISDASLPDFYSTRSENSDMRIWNSRRNLLKSAMEKAGFVQHPYEWWHFSFGDQMWAWKTRTSRARYGLVKS